MGILPSRTRTKARIPLLPLLLLLPEHNGAVTLKHNIKVPLRILRRHLCHSDGAINNGKRRKRRCGQWDDKLVIP
jgi:hypothetical protein